MVYPDASQRDSSEAEASEVAGDRLLRGDK